jgi:predicted SAM-dependent methyltransferase
MQYKHILNVMVPPERLIYPYRVTQFQQDHKSIRDSRRNQARPQADVVVNVWPPRQPDMNLIHSVRSLENKTMQEPGRRWLRETLLLSGHFHQTTGMKMFRLSGKLFS